VVRHRQALALVSDVGYLKGELRIELDLADALAKSGNYAEAISHAEHARDLAQAGSLDVYLGQALTLLAHLHVSAGHPRRGAELADQALEIHRRTGHRLGEARTLRTLGDAHHQNGRLTSAMSFWQHGLALLTTIGSPEADDLRALLQDTDSANSHHPDGTRASL
jgi:tetratricopeptide (TPR) repeat protein